MLRMLLVKYEDYKKMKIDRQIGILSLLLQKERMTAKELAEKFEVSRRTIIRDIEDINLIDKLRGCMIE